MRSSVQSSFHRALLYIYFEMQFSLHFYWNCSRKFLGCYSLWCEWKKPRLDGRVSFIQELRPFNQQALVMFTAMLNMMNSKLLWTWPAPAGWKASAPEQIKLYHQVLASSTHMIMNNSQGIFNIVQCTCILNTYGFILQDVRVWEKVQNIKLNCKRASRQLTPTVIWYTCTRTHCTSANCIILH